MGKLHEAIGESLQKFIEAQKIYFVATAPLSDKGHVNLSPKGLDSFRILGPRQVAYLDLTGSGAETIAHLKENGRITLMFCAFEGAPNIVRLQGKGEAVEPGDGRFEGLLASFPPHAGVRSVILVALDRISDSCGYGVPLYEYKGERSQLLDWAQKKGPEGLAEYRRKNNRTSIDGLPAAKVDG